MKTDKVILEFVGYRCRCYIGNICAQKGERTRKKIKNKTMDYADELKYQYDETANNLLKNMILLNEKENLSLRKGNQNLRVLKKRDKIFFQKQNQNLRKQRMKESLEV
jgi:hypothetical protein